MSPVGSDTASGLGAWTITDSPAVTDGTYNYRARATDTAGNVGISDPLQVLVVTIDTLAPAAPSTPDLDAASDSGASNSDEITNDKTPTLSGTAEANATVKLYDGASLVGTGTATGGNYSITVSSLSDGVHSIKATATDSAGNTSVDSGSLSITIDTAAPAKPTGLTTTPASPANNNGPSLDGSAEAGSLVKVFTDAACTPAAAASGTATGGSFSITVSVADDSSTTYYANATDTAGNKADRSDGSVA